VVINGKGLDVQAPQPLSLLDGAHDPERPSSRYQSCSADAPEARVPRSLVRLPDSTGLLHQGDFEEHAVGGVNNGWKVAMTTLGFERGSNSTTGYRRFLKEWEEIVKEATRLGKNDDRWCGRARRPGRSQIMEINGYRSLSRLAQRDAQHGAAGCNEQDVLSETHRSRWSWRWTCSHGSQILTARA